MIKAVIFDMWDTLIPATIDMVHLHSLVSKSGISFPEFIDRFEHAVQLKTYSSFEEMRKDFFDAFHQTDNDLLDKELYEIWFNRIDKIRFFPDVERNLVKLREKGFRLGLLSNTESLIMGKIREKLSLNKYFDAVCPSFEIHHLKPEGPAFECVLGMLKVKPNEALMVGDSQRADIFGSSKMGMHNCLINRSGKGVDGAKAKLEFVIKSFDEIQGVIGVLNG